MAASRGIYLVFSTPQTLFGNRRMPYMARTVVCEGAKAPYTIVIDL